jgi:glutamine amidotransferase
MTTISLFDYGAGNLHSLAKALARIGRAAITDDVSEALRADLLVLPGVGAFGQAAREIAPCRTEIREALAAGLPCIGVCLGMQLLFDSSEESEGEGIGLIAGRVRRINAERLPQMGWNSVDWPADGANTSLRAEKIEVGYFANSFVASPNDESCVVAWATHERDRFPSIVRSANTLGVQFHPEKSSRAGVDFLCSAAEELLSCR